MLFIPNWLISNSFLKSINIFYTSIEDNKTPTTPKPIITQTFLTNILFHPISCLYTDSQLYKFHLDRLAQESIGFLKIQCNDCEARSKICTNCKYLNSSMSLVESRQLTQMIKNVSLIPNPDGTFYVKTSFMYESDPTKLYTQQNSNFYLAKTNSLKLRTRLQKKEFLDQFHKVFQAELDLQFTKEVPFEELAKLDVLNFVSINYSLKPDSLSTKVRPVQNASFVHKKGPLNSCLGTGPNLLANPVKIIQTLRLARFAAFLDIEKAFKKIHLEDMETYLLLFCWFKDPYDESSLRVYRNLRLPFGVSNASCILEIVLRHFIAPQCKLPISQFQVNNTRYVDDYCPHTNDKCELDTIIEDLVSTHKKFGFTFKEIKYSANITNNKKFNPANTVTFLSLILCLDSDLMKPNFKLHPSKKSRGAYFDEGLNSESIQNLVVTKKVISRLLGQIFSFSNFLVEPLNAIFKIFFSLSCKLTKDWNLNLQQLDTNFVSTFKNVLTDLININDNINPLGLV